MSRIIAAVKDADALQGALATSVPLIFHLAPSISTLDGIIDIAHSSGKKIFIHMDLAEGLGKDKAGINFAKNLGVDGIISTRTNIIRFAKEEGLVAVQRFFAIDAHSVDTAVETAKASKADMIEIMPGIIPKAIEKIKSRVNVPIIAGGMIETEQEVRLALESGAWAISTSRKDLWSI